GLGVRDVIDGDELDPGVAERGAQHVPANASEAVDSNLDRHLQSSTCVRSRSEGFIFHVKRRIAAVSNIMGRAAAVGHFPVAKMAGVLCLRPSEITILRGLREPPPKSRIPDGEGTSN